MIKCINIIRKKYDRIIYVIDYEYNHHNVSHAFSANVNDYLVIPINNDYFIEKIINDYYHFIKESDDVYSYKGLFVDFKASRVKINNNQIKLTRIEIKLLKFLLQNIDRALDKKTIYRMVWGSESYDFRTVETHIKTLRKKLGEYGNNIVTIWAQGYSYTEQIDKEKSVD